MKRTTKKHHWIMFLDAGDMSLLMGTIRIIKKSCTNRMKKAKR